jgi:ribulose-5-phosphate 4-epimerase/fuculose-1-phosphate aldolase
MSITIHSKLAESRQREQIVEFGRSLFERGFTAGSNGNRSVRLDDGC